MAQSVCKHAKNNNGNDYYYYYYYYKTQSLTTERNVQKEIERLLKTET